MYHRKGYRKLGKTFDHRRAMLRNMATSFFENGRIKTTLCRAKELQSVVEKMITVAKQDTLASRRRVGEYLFKDEVAKTLVKEISPRFKDRNGGCTRIVKLGERKGDGAFMCHLELVDYNSTKS